jgi:nucleotide-binding universal stress UspA family protein
MRTPNGGVRQHAQVTRISSANYSGMTIQRILIGLDLSDVSIAAAKWASQSFAPDAEVTLAHVIELPGRPRFASDKLPPADAIEGAAREYAESRLREIASFLTPGVTGREVRVGKPAEVIPELAREVGADLVVIGPHDDRPRPSKFLGTTAERIVRTSPVPVLVAGSPGAGSPHTFLVPIDDADITSTLLAWTRDLAARFDADVTLLHVMSNAVYSHVASMSYATSRSESEAQKEIDKELAQAGVHWLEELARTGIERERVSAAVTYGKAGDAALEMANAIVADLIILGRRGSGLVAPALLGSTVGTVLHGARCPVLVIAETARTASA